MAEERQKRKTHTSSEVKARYNAKAYTQMAFSAPKDLAATFKAKCEAEGVSYASVFKKAMQDFIDG